MRVLLDTNVLVAAFIARGNSNEVFDHCLTSHRLITSIWILDELEEKLLKKFHFSKADVKAVVSLVSNNAEMSEPSGLDGKVCRDADDDNILAAALAGKADCIVTGDKDLLVLKDYRGIKILSPTDFWEFEGRER
ncbi:MAG: putative toxin-antitoxin system toxin component, PIN family [Deltaproteobacteria bacterium RIFCSPLOWO2_02_FULL_53_8]|nr:MAG: putative toxin-antitoxin system toxin component, PIN family [Deltaproteobacteria bacterium RIFCSPLOWO2_02_FULL_53_8]